MKQSFSHLVLLLATIVLLTSCAGMKPKYEPPTVGLKSFKLKPSEAIVPTFEVGLHLINPNRIPLPLKGIHYTISLDNHKVLTGVSNDLPTIAPYGEADVVINATVDLLGSIQLFQNLLSQPQEPLTYQFRAKLDVGSLAPVIRIREEGKLSSSPAR